jgi:hypothetical protein
VWSFPGAHLRVTGISPQSNPSSRESYQFILDSNASGRNLAISSLSLGFEDNLLLGCGIAAADVVAGVSGQHYVIIES